MASNIFPVNPPVPSTSVQLPPASAPVKLVSKSKAASVLHSVKFGETAVPEVGERTTVTCTVSVSATAHGPVGATVYVKL